VANLGQPRKLSGLKARFTSGPFGSIVGVMPQSLSKVIVHIIFSTKDREPWLGLDVRPRMHAYLATVCRDLGAEVVRVGGVADHVHIVTALPRNSFPSSIHRAAKQNVLKSHCRALIRPRPACGERIKVRGRS
jgi:REP element-mobilizing transposase RayT